MRIDEKRNTIIGYMHKKEMQRVTYSSSQTILLHIIRKYDEF